LLKQKISFAQQTEWSRRYQRYDRNSKSRYQESDRRYACIEVGGVTFYRDAMRTCRLSVTVPPKCSGLISRGNTGGLLDAADLTRAWRKLRVK